MLDYQDMVRFVDEALTYSGVKARPNYPALYVAAGQRRFGLDDNGGQIIDPDYQALFAALISGEPALWDDYGHYCTLHERDYVKS